MLSSSQFDVGQIKKRIRSDVARNRSRFLNGYGRDQPSEASSEAERPFTEVLQFFLSAKRSQTEKLRSVIERAREATVVNRWIPNVLRQFFRRQGGFNKSVIEALNTVLKGLATLGAEQSETRTYLNAQYYWLRDFEQRQQRLRDSFNVLLSRSARKDQSFYQLEVARDRDAEGIRQLHAFADSLLTTLDGQAEILAELKGVTSHLRDGMAANRQRGDDLASQLESASASLAEFGGSVTRQLETQGGALSGLEARVNEGLNEEAKSRRAELSELKSMVDETIRVTTAASDDFGRLLREQDARMDQLREMADELSRTGIGFKADMERLASAEQALQAHTSRLDERQLSDSAFLRGELLVQQQLLHGRLDSKNSDPKIRKPKKLGHRFDAFYVAFENRFRGTRSEIKSRFTIYLPYLAKLNISKKEIRALDVGCGRGEWLQLLRENGVSKISGVDSNTVMAAQCRALGFEVTVQDCVEYLEALEKSSINVITAFHVIEHLPFDQQMRFLSESYRTLASEGMLILETPNPDNLIVAAKNFYTDPTHQRPIPSALAAFLAEHAGFSRVEVVNQHPFAAGVSLPEESEIASRFNKLFYSHQDYAVIARKP